METGDILLCKQNYYDNNKTKLFKKPKFKKGQKYIITNVNIINNSPTALTYATITYSDYDYKFYTINSGQGKINEVVFSEIVLSDTFYTKREERNLKLKKIKQKYDS